MAVSTKGKRKVNVQGRQYIWHVVDDEAIKVPEEGFIYPQAPARVLHIVSSNKQFIVHYRIPQTGDSSATLLIEGPLFSRAPGAKSVEVPRWRHAMINFPHPLLQQGLVILDTPGLNAIGTEPELTLSLLPNAHAVIFILAADTGVTQSDLAVWNEHIGAPSGRKKGRIVVLNKIDSMWDELKSAGAVEGEVQKQVTTSAGVLGLPESQIFPVSAQKALVAKVNGDAALLARSRLPELEHALARDLIPIKHELVGEACLADLRDITAGLTAILETRARNIVDQHSELTALRGKNEDVVLTMMKKVAAEKEQFEKGLQLSLITI